MDGLLVDTLKGRPHRKADARLSRDISNVQFTTRQTGMVEDKGDLLKSCLSRRGEQLANECVYVQSWCCLLGTICGSARREKRSTWTLIRGTLSR